MNPRLRRVPNPPRESRVHPQHKPISSPQVPYKRAAPRLPSSSVFLKLLCFFGSFDNPVPAVPSNDVVRIFGLGMHVALKMTWSRMKRVLAFRRAGSAEAFTGMLNADIEPRPGVGVRTVQMGVVRITLVVAPELEHYFAAGM